MRPRSLVHVDHQPWCPEAEAVQKRAESPLQIMRGDVKTNIVEHDVLTLSY